MDFRFSSTILYTYALYNSTLLQSSCSTKPSPHALYIPTTKESPTITVSKDCTKSNPFPLLSYRAMEEKFDRVIINSIFPPANFGHIYLAKTFT